MGSKAKHIKRRAQRDKSWIHLCGQLSHVACKTIEPMVLTTSSPKKELPTCREMIHCIDKGCIDS